MNQTNEKKGNSKLYWILGGVGALVVVGVFLIISLAVGIFYFSDGFSDDEKIIVKKTQNLKDNNKDSKISEKDKKTKETLDDVKINFPPMESENPARDNSAVSSSLIKFLKQKYSTVGSFKLIEAKPFKSSLFGSSDFTVVGNYNESKSKEVLSHWYVHYSDWETAKSEARRRIASFKKDDPEMKVTDKGDSIVTAFFSADRLNRLDCRKSKKGKGNCDFITTKDSQQLLRYLSAYHK